MSLISKLSFSISSQLLSSQCVLALRTLGKLHTIQTKVNSLAALLWPLERTNFSPIGRKVQSWNQRTLSAEQLLTRVTNFPESKKFVTAVPTYATSSEAILYLEELSDEGFKALSSSDLTAIWKVLKTSHNYDLMVELIHTCSNSKWLQNPKVLRDYAEVNLLSGYANPTLVESFLQTLMIHNPDTLQLARSLKAGYIALLLQDMQDKRLPTANLLDRFRECYPNQKISESNLLELYSRTIGITR